MDEGSQDDEPQHLSIFDDKDLVALLLSQPPADAEEVESTEPPVISVESTPVENLDHVYHKQLQPSAKACDTSAAPVAVTQQLLVPLDNMGDLSRPASSLSICPQSPLSCSSSSGYDSDYKDPENNMAWEETFSDLFPDLV